jgi:hypothetical protein
MTLISICDSTRPTRFFADSKNLRIVLGTLALALAPRAGAQTIETVFSDSNANDVAVLNLNDLGASEIDQIQITSSAWNGGGDDSDISAWGAIGSFGGSFDDAYGVGQAEYALTASDITFQNGLWIANSLSDNLGDSWSDVSLGSGDNLALHAWVYEVTDGDDTTGSLAGSDSTQLTASVAYTLTPLTPPAPAPPPPPPPASGAISVAPSSGTAPLTVTVSWNTANADSASADGPGLASSQLAGSETVTLASAGSYSWSLNAQGAGGGAEQVATAVAAAPAPAPPPPTPPAAPLPPAPPPVFRIRFNTTGTEARVAASGRGSSPIWTDPALLSASPWPDFSEAAPAAVAPANFALPAAPSAPGITP